MSTSVVDQLLLLCASCRDPSQHALQSHSVDMSWLDKQQQKEEELDFFSLLILAVWQQVVIDLNRDFI